VCGIGAGLLQALAVSRLDVGSCGLGYPNRAVLSSKVTIPIERGASYVHEIVYAISFEHP